MTVTLEGRVIPPNDWQPWNAPALMIVSSDPATNDTTLSDSQLEKHRCPRIVTEAGMEMD
jgi:hypothetical protein